MAKAADKFTVVSDVVHAQTTWFGALAQARHRLDERISIAASAGAAYSDLGPLFSGELTGRYDLTDQVGLTLGARSLSLYYDLKDEENDVINNPVRNLPPVGIRSHFSTEWSHNLELVTGMYFRF